MAPFPLCCVAGLASGESVATFAAAASGLVTGQALDLLIAEGPNFKDPSAPVGDLVAEHKRIVKRSHNVQAPLIVLGTVAAAASAAANREKHAAAPLAVAALVNTVVIGLSLTLVNKAEKAIEALPPAVAGSPGKKDNKMAAAEKDARDLLQRWSKLHSVRTALAGFAFGSTLCGVLLLNKKN